MIDDQIAVVGYFKHRSVTVLEPLAGLAVPVPDEANADIPGFRRYVLPTCVINPFPRITCNTCQLTTVLKRPPTAIPCANWPVAAESTARYERNLFSVAVGIQNILGEFKFWGPERMVFGRQATARKT